MWGGPDGGVGMRPHTADYAALALATLQGAGLGTLLVLGIALRVDAGSDHSQGASKHAAYARLVERAALQCSLRDSDPRASSTAVIRRPDGRLKVVSFERGWTVYTAERPGKLVAVCFARAAPTASTS